MLLLEVVDAFEKARIKYALVGGYALALHGIVRATMDVDLVLQLTSKDFSRAEEALGTIGLKSRLPLVAHEVVQMRREYIERRNLLVWSFVDSSSPHRVVDLLLNHDLKDLEVEKISVGTRRIVVATLAQLLKMKTSAGRPQDLIDIERIKEKMKSEKT